MKYNKKEFLSGLAAGLCSGPDTPCLTFWSEAEFSIKKSPPLFWLPGTFEYSTDKKTWRSMGGDGSAESANGRLYLRGKTDHFYNPATDGWEFTFTSGHDIHCEGNVETLVDYEAVQRGEHPSMGHSTFRGLFDSAVELVTPPELPATNLFGYEYSEMFKGCVKLTRAPRLPATTLAPNCYRGMFSGCTSLLEAPELPATTLATECYREMFRGCTSLITPPALPATTLATGCYRDMFVRCTSLERIPLFPQIQGYLPYLCYLDMFAGCSSLNIYRSAGAFPFVIPGEKSTGATDAMFQGCGGDGPRTPETNTTYYTDYEPVSAEPEPEPEPEPGYELKRVSFLKGYLTGLRLREYKADSIVSQ